jgi:importin subunit beta-1
LEVIVEDVGDPILQICTSFIESVYSGTTPIQKQAAMKAFMCILSGPSPQRVQSLIVQALIPLLDWLDDPNEQTKSVAAEWALRVAETHPIAMLHPQIVQEVMRRLLNHLEKEPRVSQLASKFIRVLNSYASPFTSWLTRRHRFTTMLLSRVN